MRAIGRDEVQLYSPPRPSEPFAHDPRVMIARVVEKDMDEDQHRVERLDRFQKPDRRGGVDGFDLDHSGLAGLEIYRTMDVDALAAKSRATLTPPLKSPSALISLRNIGIGRFIFRVQ